MKGAFARLVAEGSFTQPIELDMALPAATTLSRG